MKEEILKYINKSKKKLTQTESIPRWILMVIRIFNYWTGELDKSWKQKFETKQPPRSWSMILVIHHCQKCSSFYSHRFGCCFHCEKSQKNFYFSLSLIYSCWFTLTESYTTSSSVCVCGSYSYWSLDSCNVDARSNCLQLKSKHNQTFTYSNDDHDHLYILYMHVLWESGEFYHFYFSCLINVCCTLSKWNDEFQPTSQQEKK